MLVTAAARASRGRARAWPPRAGTARAATDAAPRPYWLDAHPAPPLEAPVRGELECDLAIVGGGFTGLWTALIAKEREPRRDVVLVEAEHVAFGASGRNGGFAEHSLTHGL